MKIQVYDTLRDGSQSPGLDLKAYQKLRLAEALSRLATSESPVFEEFGWPGSNVEDRNVYPLLGSGQYNLENIIPVVFGSTRKPGMIAWEDETIRSLIDTMQYGVRVATIFGKADPHHVKYVLKTSLEDNLAMVRGSVKALRDAGMAVIFDAEHFFDGLRKDNSYALQVLAAAATAGAEHLVLCDSNGGSMPVDIGAAMLEVKKYLAQQGINIPLGIHAHDDGNLAVANSLEAIMKGASQVQGCMIPMGERAGNAPLSSVVSWLHFGFNGEHSNRLPQGLEVPELNYVLLKPVADFFYLVTGIVPNPWQPFVGRNAGIHTAGVHQDAENKHPGAYTAFDLAEIGNGEQQLVLGLQSGSAHIVAAARELLGITVSKTDPAVQAVLSRVKEMSEKGYNLGFVRAEQELLLMNHFGRENPFYVRKWDASTGNDDGHTNSTCCLELELYGDTVHARCPVKDNGPVDAMYLAMLDGLKSARRDVGEVEIVGYNVSLAREEGAGSPVRVYFEFSWPPVGRWGCVGVSRNNIEAALEALVKGVNYALLKAEK